MRNKVLTILGAALAGMTLAAPAGALVIRDGTADSLYTNLANSYSSVGQIYGTDSQGAFAASGVLIAPGWVLTAGHVTSGATSLTFFLDSGGTNFTRSGGVSASQWYSNPRWNGNLSLGYDIGLIHLGTSESCVSGGTCAVAQRYTGTSELGGVGTEVGFGMTGTGSTGATIWDGLKRAGQNMVDATYRTPGQTSRILLADFDSNLASDNNFGSKDPLGLESLIAPGDSGGGLFENIGGINFLVGITSFGWGRLDGNPDSDYGDVGGWTRVSQFNSWIDSVIGGFSSTSLTASAAQSSGLLATDVAVDLAVDVPEPATLLILLGALAPMIGVRRRHARHGRDV
ncbi:MAG: trypsin-like serine protease [Proteobacteria bacterium]|nr:trypsin-like serine protease [Pseudomonadota bacterium]